MDLDELLGTYATRALTPDRIDACCTNTALPLNDALDAVARATIAVNAASFAPSAIAYAPGHLSDMILRPLNFTVRLAQGVIAATVFHVSEEGLST
jgi:hypothetical protein